MDCQYDVIIIGAGPAGMTAAIYCARSNLKTLILESGAPGGKMVNTAEIANWPGTTSINGADLALSMFNHVNQLKVEYRYGEVKEIVDNKETKEVNCLDGNSYTSKAVIIASGTKERLMNIPGEKELIGKGISFCAVCDGAFFKDEDIVVIGGGNAALEEALYLTQFVKTVTIVIRRDVFRAAEEVINEVKENKKIRIIYKHLPFEVISEDNKVSALVIENVDTLEKTTIETKAIFPYIGADPATAFVSALGITNQEGYLLVDDKMATVVPGIYGAGDVCWKTLRQVVTAANDGAIAAVSIGHYLK